MSDIFGAFQELLRSPEPNYRQFCRFLESRQDSLTRDELVRSNILNRLTLALDGFTAERAGTSDVSVLLRQTIRAYGRRLLVKQSLWQVLSSREQAIGLRSTQECTPDMIEITADPWHPSWLTSAQDIDELEVRRQDVPVIGDGILYAMSGGTFATYQSEAQKAAVQACLFAPYGSTLLITLPTGAGKSLCVQLPAWQESRGGRIKGGTTIVVVPTVSLALDQEKQAQHYFGNSASVEYKPCSLTGSTREIDKTPIRNGLRNGTLPILYTSPESLMNSSLYHICLEAATEGTINRLVIDEAHLVETWGAGFRTEFQFLSAYRRKLLQATQGRLRTLLLSATVTKTCERLLKKLFASKDTFYSVRADQLRPEISYWFDYTHGEATRQEHVMDALRHLPRPAILYVISPDDTNVWLELMRSQGFERVAAFSGETDPDERLRLINEWNNNRRDVMVATSAFGVGVDKSDVRTIIHACLPENINRFYQEVGRAGRDGYSAISLMCTTKDDQRKAREMIRSARIKTKTATPRWEGMQSTQHFMSERGDIVLVDTNATPSENPEMLKGPSNREWNEHTLLLMQRAGLIDISDTGDEHALDVSFNVTNDNAPPVSNPVWLQVQLLHPSVTTSPRGPEFQDKFEQTRRDEVDRINQTLVQLQKTALSYAKLSAIRCLAHAFAEAYPGIALACGGCSFCRKEMRIPYARPCSLDIDLIPSLPPSTGHSLLREKIGGQNRVNVILDSPREIAALMEIRPLLVRLVEIGFQQLLLPDTLVEDTLWANALIRELAGYTVVSQAVFPISWLLEHRPIGIVPTVAVYPLQDQAADEFHQALQQQISQHRNSLLIAIVHRAIWLQSERGLYVERINGLSRSAGSLLTQLGDSQELTY